MIEAGDQPSPAADAAASIEALLLGEEPTLTRVEVAEQAGVPLELAETLWRQLGFPHRSDDDVAFSQCDVDALRSADDLVRMGVLSEGSQAALVRTWGRSYARLAEWQTTLLAELAVEGDDPEVRLAELASTVLPSVESLQSYVWRRHLASAATHRVRDAAALEPGEAELTVCFIDIVGYTARSRGLEGSELVSWVEQFEQETTLLVVDHGGQVIKTIGDEILFTVGSPAAAVDIALALTARGTDEEDPFPAVRVGISHGPVVRRLGDVFGSTVNAAARLTSAARPGTVVVDLGVHEALGSHDASDLRWRKLRRVPAKGFSHLDAWRVKPPRDAS